RARAQPLPVALGDDRRLEGDVRDRERVVEAIRELEGALDVFAGRLEVALAARAARTPLENVGAQPVARKSGTVGELERLGQQRVRARDRRQLVAADTHAIEHVRSLDVGKAVLLGELTPAYEQIERRSELALRQAGPALGQQRAKLELTRLRRVRHVLESLERLVEALPLDGGLGAHDRGLDLGVLVPGLAGLEVRRIDAQALGDPRERLRRRPCLAALDL